MTNHLLNIASRVVGRPLLLEQGKAEVILDVLSGRMGYAFEHEPMQPEASRFFGSHYDSHGNYNAIEREGSVGIIRVLGSLVNRGAYVGASSGVTSYEGLEHQMREAAADDSITSVIVDMNSSGGEAAGMFSVAKAMADLRAVKPVVVVVNETCASAAYGIASQASEIVISETSFVGSIGVVMTHVDASAKLEKDGLKVTMIHEGKHKVDGNPFEPLADGVLERFKADAGYFYSMFVSLVAHGRGDRTTEEQARATEARVYIGQHAIDAGLADRMASFRDVLAELTTTNAGDARSNLGNVSMTDNTTTPTASITQQQMDAAVATAKAEGVKGERDRFAAILGSDEAKANMSLAMHLASNTDMDADGVKAALAAAGPAASASTESGSRIETVADRAEHRIDANTTGTKTKAEEVDAMWDSVLG